MEQLLSFCLGNNQKIRLEKWDELMEDFEGALLDKKEKMLSVEKIKNIEDVSEVYKPFKGFRDRLHYEAFQEILDFGFDKNYKYPVVLVDCVSGEIPYIAYNRSVKGNRMPLLWPLNYHIKEAKEGFKDNILFKDKLPKIFFRGALSSHVESKIMNGIHKPSRFVVTEKYLKHPDIDLGLTYIPNKEPLVIKKHIQRIRKCLKEKVEKEDQFRYKYILCLEGADISSSIGWVLASNCVPIMPFPYIYETYFFYDLRPWVNFVPCDPKCENLDSILKYLESNQDICDRIAYNGKKYAEFVFEDKTIKEVKKSISKTWKLV